MQETRSSGLHPTRASANIEHRLDDQPVPRAPPGFRDFDVWNKFPRPASKRIASAETQSRE